MWSIWGDAKCGTVVPQQAGVFCSDLVWIHTEVGLCGVTTLCNLRVPEPRIQDGLEEI